MKYLKMRFLRMDFPIEVVEVEEKEAMAVRTVVSNDRIGEAMGSIFYRVMDFVAERGAVFDGPPFAFYHSYNDERTDMTCGFPVKQAIDDDEDIRPFKIPGGRAVTAVHVGPYDKVIDTYHKVQEFIEAEGLRPSAMWEYYLNDPEENPPEKLLTQLYWKVD